MKPQVLQLNPILIPAINDQLASRYTVHKLFEVDDKDAWLREHGASIQAVTTGGHTGISRAMLEQLPNLKVVAVNGVGTVAVSTAKRTSALPDVPTADEQGLKGYDANTNGGFLAPAGTPKAIVAKLNTEINAALKLPDVRAKLEAAGIEIQGGTPQDYAALIKSDLVKWGKVVKAAGIQPD